VTATVKPVSRLVTRVQVAITGKRPDTDFSTYPYSRIELAAYTLVGIGATYDVSSVVHLHGRVENLLDKSYQEVYGYGAARRGVYVGLSLSR
jgi:vitamin B12 transporter